MRGLIILFIFFIGALTGPAYADSPQASTPSSRSQLLLNGELVANEISRATGCAISPILGISVLGAYTYYTTPFEERDQVPWHAKPEFWVPLLIILLGIILKDSSKIALPKIIIIPLDAFETLFEKNVSAVLGLLVILSSIAGRTIEQLQLGRHSLGFSLLPTAYAADSAAGATISTAGSIELGALSILVTVVFALVWVVSQSFNFLIFLSPSSWLDLLLTMSKNAIIALLVGASLINPYLGLLVSSIIIIISLFLFARSYRFVIFGTVFSFDMLFTRSREHKLKTRRIKGFAGSIAPEIPALSYGSLTTRDSQLIFHYRPWLFMPLKSITTTYRCEQCTMGKGTLSPVIITTGQKSRTDLTLFRLRPFYRSHEVQIAQFLELNGVKDVAFGKTIRDGFRWLKGQLPIFTRIKQDQA